MIDTDFKYATFQKENKPNIFNGYLVYSFIDNNAVLVSAFK